MRLARVALLLACAPSTGTPEPSGEEPVVPKAATASPSEPTDPSYEIVKKICASPCAGPHATLVMFRRDNGELGVVRFEGDLESCSHPPWLYFDPKGNEILAIPEEPVVPGSAEAKAFAAKQEAVVAGMKEAERFWCPDAPRCEPSRTEGFRSDYPCRSDQDCLSCGCAPINRAEWNRRGGGDACDAPNEECIATNGACCDGKCSLAR